MSKIFKLYNSEEAAINNGCSEDQITSKNGVYYCDCACDSKLSDIEVKEAKVVKTTKEFKLDNKKTK